MKNTENDIGKQDKPLVTSALKKPRHFVFRFRRSLVILTFPLIYCRSNIVESELKYFVLSI